MTNLLLYMLEASICLSLFYAFYRYVYYRLTYFEWNRYYFIVSLIISFILPFLRFTFFGNNQNISAANSLIMIKNGVVEPFIVTTQKNNLVNSLNTFFNNFDYLKISTIIFVIYLSGIIRYSITFLISIIKIVKLKQRAILIIFNNLRLVKIEHKATAFSFFRTIFVNRNFENLSDNEKNKIIEHESIHVNQLHTLDGILFELVGIIFWFNPLMKNIKRSVKEIHEYIVDVKMIGNKKSVEYSNLLIKLSDKITKQRVRQTKSKLFNRLSMLLSADNEKVRKTRFMVAFPVLFIAILSYIFTMSVCVAVTNETEYESKLNFPVKSDYKLLAVFFKDKIIETNNSLNNQLVYKVSHKEITLQTKDFTPVYSMSDGIVDSILISDNWGVEEVQININYKNNIVSIYKGLEKYSVKQGQTVDETTIVGYTGDLRFYPSISIQVLNNGIPVDPFEYLNNIKF